MRIAILSDIHGNLLALETVLADLPRHRVDLTINLGDCATGPLWPLETVQLLESLQLPTVRGNHDRWLVESPPGPITSSIAFTRGALGESWCARLHALPPALEPHEGVLAVHGTPHDDTSYLLEDSDGGPLQLATATTLASRLGGVTAGLILCGHSHTQHIALAPGNRLIVNPGSVGLPRYVENPAVPLQEASAPHARYAIATRGAGGWAIECVALSYDFASVARQARVNGRPEWADRFMAACGVSPFS
jgi:predicted phosphodiesterase